MAERNRNFEVGVRMNIQSFIKELFKPDQTNIEILRELREDDCEDDFYEN